MDRRLFLVTTARLTALATTTGISLRAAEPEKTLTPRPTHISARKLPRWRGFNLLEKFITRKEGNPPFRELDFQWMRDWGFDFARLPMSYLCWSDPGDWTKFREAELKHVDEAVEWGRKYGVHVNLNFHRAPGYCVNPPAEPLDLWKSDQALDVCAQHWAAFAKRYRGLPNQEVSFDLLNEPPDITVESYSRVVRRLVAAIRAEDPQRLIIADGLRYGRRPVPAFADLGIAQSTRGYDPMRVSHHQANWVNGADKWPAPAWPLTSADGKPPHDQARLRQEIIKPWKDLEALGVGVHIGEAGCYNKTPHSVALAWLEDYLQLWKEVGWGWALWNLRGTFGIVDSSRSDVAYEDYQGHKLDRAMLDLLRKY